LNPEASRSRNLSGFVHRDPSRLEVIAKSVKLVGEWRSRGREAFIVDAVVQAAM
jgi:hypothetical protein